MKEEEKEAPQRDKSVAHFASNYLHHSGYFNDDLTSLPLIQCAEQDAGCQDDAQRPQTVQFQRQGYSGSARRQDEPRPPGGRPRCLGRCRHCRHRRSTSAAG